MKTTCIVAWLVLVLSVGAFAQSAKRSFEVATVRASVPGSRLSQRLTQTRLDMVNTPIRSLILEAFRIDVFQLSAPDWLSQPRFDVHATFPAGTTRDQVFEMLQTLLTERFGLVSHVESRPVPAFELVVGKGGIAIREVEAVDELTKEFPKDPSITGSNFDMTNETLDGPVRNMMIPFGGRNVTARSLYDYWTTPRRTFQVEAARITMGEFATLLALNVDRPVIDKTGLTGVYQFKVELDASQGAVRVLRQAGVVDRVPDLNEPTGVSTFAAVERLGLKLEERRAPFGILVVDKIDRQPTEP